MSRYTILRMPNAKPFGTFSIDTWPMTETGIKILNTLERKICRMIYRSLVKRGMPRIRINQELQEVYRDSDVVTDTTKNSFDLMGHVVIMESAKGQFPRAQNFKKG